MENDKYIVNKDPFDAVRDFFKGDTIKSILWFNISNPLLGDVTPLTYLLTDREGELADFIKKQIYYNDNPTLGILEFEKEKDATYDFLEFYKSKNRVYE